MMTDSRQGRGRGPEGAGAMFALFWGIVAASSVFAEDRVIFIENMAVDTQEEASGISTNFYESQMKPLGVQPSVLPMSPLRAARIPVVRTDEERARARALIESAMKQLAENAPARALIELRDALALEPDNLFALQRAALIAINLHDYSRAEAYAARFLETQPNDAQLWAVRGAALLRMSRLDDAQTSLNHALELDPNHVLARFQSLVLRLIREGPVDEQEFWRQRRMEDLLRIANELTTERKDLAAILGEGDFARLVNVTLGDGAAEHLNEVLDLMNQAILADPPRPLEERLTLLARLAQLGVQPYGSLVLQADWLAALNRPDDAAAVWDTIMKRFGTFPDALLNGGTYDLRRGDTGSAITRLREARKLLRLQRAGIVDFVLACALAKGGKSGNQEEAQAIFNQLAIEQPKSFRQWLDSDTLFQESLRRMPNYRSILRRLDIPPEAE